MSDALCRNDVQNRDRVFTLFFVLFIASKSGRGDTVCDPRGFDVKMYANKDVLSKNICFECLSQAFGIRWAIIQRPSSLVIHSSYDATSVSLAQLCIVMICLTSV
jgi:hypothetical protein